MERLTPEQIKVLTMMINDHNTNGYTQGQKQIIKKIIDEKVNSEKFFNQIWERMKHNTEISQYINQSVSYAIAQIGAQWASYYLKNFVEEYTKIYLKEHMFPIFKSEVMNSLSVNEFIKEQHENIKSQIKTASNDIIQKIISENKELNPIIESYLLKLKTENMKILLSQSETLRKGLDDIGNVKNMNEQTNNKMKKMENVHNNIIMVMIAYVIVSFTYVMSSSKL